MRFIQQERGGVKMWFVDTWLTAGVFHGFVGNSYNAKSTKAFSPIARLFFSQSCVENVLYLKQVHSNHVVILDSKGILEQDCPEGDAWFGNRDRRLSHCFGIQTADCFPILVWDRKEGSVGAAHCGWRGSVAGVLPRLLEVMTQRGSSPENIELAIGPGARECCYEIQSDVIAVIHESVINPDRYLRRDGAKTYFKLSTLLLAQAVKAGLSNEKILNFEGCTICSDDFFSYRRTRTLTQRQLSFIG